MSGPFLDPAKNEANDEAAGDELDTCVCGHDRKWHQPLDTIAPTPYTKCLGGRATPECGCDRFDQRSDDGPAALKRMLSF